METSVIKTTQDCKDKAQECYDRANSTTNSDLRALFLALAKDWEHFATEAEKTGGFVRGAPKERKRAI